MWENRENRESFSEWGFMNCQELTNFKKLLKKIGRSWENFVILDEK